MAKKLAGSNGKSTAATKDRGDVAAVVIPKMPPEFAGLNESIESDIRKLQSRKITDFEAKVTTDNRRNQVRFFGYYVQWARLYKGSRP